MPDVLKLFRDILIFAIVWLLVLSAGFIVFARWAKAQEVEIITLVDVSSSVSGKDYDFVVEGLAGAVTDPRFASALGSGVWFEAFSWSSLGYFDQLVPRMLIRGPDEAATAAALLRQKSRGHLQRHSNSSALAGHTDLSAAIDEAVSRLIVRIGSRRVINVIADGPDNIPSLQHSGVEDARDRAFVLGITINAVVYNDGVDDEDYFWRRVITGPGAFVMVAEASSDLPAVLQRKFWQDLVASQVTRARG